MRKSLVALSFCALVAGCGGSENSDGSKASTYSSCTVTKTASSLPANQASDLAQCWDGVDYKEKNLALDWCAGKVSTYIANRYPILGATLEYQVASTNCP